MGRFSPILGLPHFLPYEKKEEKKTEQEDLEIFVAFVGRMVIQGC